MRLLHPAFAVFLIKLQGFFQTVEHRLAKSRAPRVFPTSGYPQVSAFAIGETASHSSPAVVYGAPNPEKESVGDIGAWPDR